jgi:type VI protein secretion system component VasF
VGVLVLPEKHVVLWDKYLKLYFLEAFMKKKTNFQSLKAEERRLLTELNKLDVNDDKYDKLLTHLIKIREAIIKSTDAYTKRREIVSSLVPIGVSTVVFLLSLFVEYSGDSMFTSEASKALFKKLTK